MMTHYVALDVQEGASIQEIRDAWRSAARRLHPDSGSGDADRFRLASEAWTVLRDEALRATYDAELRSSRVPRCQSCGGTVIAGHALCTLCQLGRVGARQPAPTPTQAPVQAPVQAPPPASPPPRRRSRPLPQPDPVLPPLPEEPAEARARREAWERAAAERTRVFDEAVPSADTDSLLSAFLADAAVRAASGKPGKPAGKLSKKRKSKADRLEVQVAPGFTVSLEGDVVGRAGEVNARMGDVAESLLLANRLFKSVTKFFGA